MLRRLLSIAILLTLAAPFVAAAPDAPGDGDRHWSLQPIADPAPPQVAEPAANPIDNFILATLAENGLTLSPEADRRTLIRRVYLVMLGLPPAPEEVDAFIADTSADAYDKLVDRVLASPRYGEAWAQHWLDVVRYADTHGFEVNTPRPNAWPYRDYVIESLNSDKPYDRFMLEQVAGDALGVDPATGFLVAGPVVLPGQVGQDEASIKGARSDQLNEIVTAVGGAFVGLTIGCARCHDHKFDPVTQADHYQLRAIFAGVQYADRPWRQLAAADGAALRDPVRSDLNTDRFEPVTVRALRFVVERTNNGNNPCIDELEAFDGDRNVALAALGVVPSASGSVAEPDRHMLAYINDGLVGNEHSWIADTADRGWVRLDFPQPVRIDRVVWARDREGKYDDRTPVDYRIEVTADGDTWSVVASSADRITPRGMVYAGSFSDPPPTHLLYRGDAMAPRDAVNPDIPAVLGSLGLPADAPEQQRRLAFGKWLGSPDNPLTPRVAVNRIWQHHFGTGLVDTPTDFGGNGVAPSHPELLDWLARRFVESGWSIKHVHRLILTSRTFRQSNASRPDAMKVDAGTRLLWRYPSRRLAAEPIRDDMLAAAGVLDLTMGGPGYDLFAPNDNYVRVYEPKEQWGPGEFRRMIYASKVRMEVAPVVGAFDCPDAGQGQAKRPRSTTPIQALNLFNSSFTMTVAAHLADRARREAGDDPATQIDRLFALTLQRSPTPDERSASVAFVATQGLPALARVLYNTNEFLFIP